MELVDQIGKWLLLAWLGYCIFVGLREAISNFRGRPRRETVNALVSKPHSAKSEARTSEFKPSQSTYQLPCETRVAGVSFPNKDDSSRQEILAAISLGSSLTLEREPDNPFDQNAIKVNSASGSLGYLPKTLAHQLNDTDINKLVVHLINKGKSDTNIYWAKIRIDKTETSQDELAPVVQTNFESSIEPADNISVIEIGSRAAPPAGKKFFEINDGVSFPNQTRLPGRGLTGYVSLKRTYLPYSFPLTIQVFNEFDRQPFRDSELREILLCGLQSEISDLANLEIWPVQSLDQDAYELWKEKVEQYSKALRLCREDTTFQDIWCDSDSMLLLPAANFMMELQDVRSHIVTEEIKGYSVDGLFQGAVEITSSDSLSYFKGLYVDGLKNGKGREVTPEGDTYEGEFLNGLRCGIGVLRQNNGSLSGIFINGRHYGAVSFNDFQPPEFWIGFHANLNKIMFVPRVIPKGAKVINLCAIFPETWEVIEINVSEMGKPLRQHIKSLPPSEQAEIEATLEAWKKEFKNNIFIKVLSRIYPVYLSENFEAQNARYAVAHLKEKIAESSAFSSLTRDEKIQKIRELINII